MKRINVSKYSIGDIEDILNHFLGSSYSIVEKFFEKDGHHFLRTFEWGEKKFKLEFDNENDLVSIIREDKDDEGNQRITRTKLIKGPRGNCVRIDTKIRELNFYHSGVF